ncbi:MAG: EamA family transporter [Candidatus Accumulibacter sp.]|uniref:DMT family transporter n=1 Tax=Accumulibacter sp. TaxID=2053492 RepID=UPI00258AA41E|nr:DMT family transporter [Accumulibacter sp.]MCM8621461.1 EamA family transporter [Accumulibacter sp.]
MFLEAHSAGIGAALMAAVLFGASTPVAKLLLGSLSPWLMAGLLYLGSGFGLGLIRVVQKSAPVHLEPREWGWLAAAILAGGVAGPVLLMIGLADMPASGASLLLNAEGVFTALLAWFAFHENFDRRIALGMLAIVAGATVLAWPGEASFGEAWPALAVLGACFSWALDNNLTRKVALADATWIAASKGLVAGMVNLAIAATMIGQWPSISAMLSASVLGLFSYGFSLTLFVVALRHLGSARTGAYFSIAPFVGALISLPLLGEELSSRLLLAGGLMAWGVWLHLTEHHAHEHRHEVLEHSHEHDHDAHHQHEHESAVPPGVRHSHVHRHEALAHSHAHFPDAHHRHAHNEPSVS